jgi:hypothetical protein
LLHLLVLFFPEQIANLVVVEIGEVVPVADILQIALQIVLILESIHHPHRFFKRERLVT